MSALHITQIENRIQTLLSPHIDMDDQRTGTSSYDDMLRSRALAAYLVHHLTGCTPQESAACIVDGSDDNGIDAIYFHEPDEKLYLVQSKWFKDGRGEPENSAIKKFTAGVRDLLAQNYDRFNEKINARVTEIDGALSIPTLKVIVVLVHSGNATSISEMSTRDFSDLESEINDASETLSWMVINQGQLHRSLTEDLNIAINVQIPIHGWGKVQEPTPAFYGMVSAADLGAMWEEHKDRLVAKNLRGSLGDTDVNKEIRDSLETRPEHFWYFNNGVTAVAHSVVKSPIGGGKHDLGYFQCNELYVVNGAQTVSSIGKFIEKNPEKDLTGCFVQFRVIQLGESGEEFGDDVTRTNNRQNRIETRDFVSQDPEQKRLRSELLIEKIQYHIMRRDEQVVGDRAFDLQEGTSAVACAAGDVAILVTLKNQIGRLWEDTSKAPYRTLFNPSVSGVYVWNCVRVLRLVETALDKRRKRSTVLRELRILASGNRVIAAIVFKLVSQSKLSNAEFDLETYVTVVRVQNATDAAADHTLDFMKQFYNRSIVANFFKNQSKSRELYEFLSNRFAKSQIFNTSVSPTK